MRKFLYPGQFEVVADYGIGRSVVSSLLQAIERKHAIQKNIDVNCTIFNFAGYIVSTSEQRQELLLLLDKVEKDGLR